MVAKGVGIAEICNSVRFGSVRSVTGEPDVKSSREA